MFKSAGANSLDERACRPLLGKNLLRFGIEYLDDATAGIFQDDLVLLGGPSGVGKTQLCCNIALANLFNEKKIHYIALEASRFEIERRFKYSLVTERFFSDHGRPKISEKITYPTWLLGKHEKVLAPYEDEADKFFESAFRDLFILYKTKRFGVSELIEAVLSCSSRTDLIIIDHVHYFDLDDENENRAIREIAKTVRTLALEEQKPIVLVAHLRKRDKQNEDLVADLDEFHGSSDLYKIATKVITFAPGRLTPEGTYETFFRVAKDRIDGGVTRFIGREFFSPKRGAYEQGKYQIGWAGRPRKEGFSEIDGNLLPPWAKGSYSPRIGGGAYPGFPRQPRVPRASGGAQSDEAF